MKKHIPLSLCVLVISITTTIVYYLQSPKIVAADTPSYLNIVDKISKYPFDLADPIRLPGYPLLILLAGQNLYVTTFIQSILFNIIVLETYALCLLLFHRLWLAFIISALIGTNPVLLAFFSQIMTECLACFFLTTTALLCVYFRQNARTWILWSIGFCLFALFFTRPEWIALPPLIFFLLYLTSRKQYAPMTLIRIGLISCSFIYICAFTYILGNTFQYHFKGLSSIPNINFFGKVLQYNMQDETDQNKTRIVLDRCIAKIDRDPYHLLPCMPQFDKNYATPAGEFAQAIIKNHPGEFMLKTVPLFFSSLTDYFDPSSTNNPFLQRLKIFQKSLYFCNLLFPLCALLWFCPFPKLKAYRSTILILISIVTYGILVTALAGYTASDYMRFHTVFSPLLIITLWSFVLLTAEAIVKSIKIQKRSIAVEAS